MGGAHWGSERLPPALRGKVFKAFVKGMMEVMAVVKALLERGRAPTTATVSEVLFATRAPLGKELGLCLNRHMVSHFFGKGGRVEHILQALVDEAASFYEACEEAVSEGVESEG